MNIVAKLIAVAMVATAAVVSGCKSSANIARQDPKDVAYTLAAGKTFNEVVNVAAARRRWLPQSLENGSVRCIYEQRAHRVVVDVVPGSGSFSIVFVESNIPDAKYNQWVNNLCREIVARAAK